MKRISLFFAAFAAVVSSIAQTAVQEETGVETALNTGMLNAGIQSRGLNMVPQDGLLLVPESSGDRVMAFDPGTGDLVNEYFIKEDSLDFFTTPIMALQPDDQETILVSDQVGDVVLEFDFDGQYQGFFAPAGGPDPSIADNVRGITMKHGTDHLLVCDGNHDAILEFDADGNYVGNFTAPGLIDPFSVVYWAENDQYLASDISGSGDNDRVVILDTAGNYLGDFANGLDFPEQIAFNLEGNILVACFSSPSGIYEYQPDGTLLYYLDVVSSCRGVYALPNSNYLVSAGDALYEIDKNNQIVDIKYQVSSASLRFISLVEPPVSQNPSVTFRVDMSYQTVPPEGVHIAGSFQGWDPGATIMTPDTGNVYVYTATFEPGTYLEYKFINGDEWGEDESIPPGCSQNNNRYLTVPSNDTVLPAVCFASCNPCGTLVDVTFKVDMAEQTVSPDGVHIAGSFQGWDPSATMMSNTVDDIYEVTVQLLSGETVEYKFINGTDWSQEEIVPAECGVPNGVGGYNRFYDVPAGGGVLEAVCFGSCDPCSVNPVQIEVTFRVDMSEQVVSPEGVHLAGDFQGWDPAASTMLPVGDSIYELTVMLNENSVHQYKFINGNTWDGEETVPPECGIDNGVGGYNRYIELAQSDTVLTTVCFSSCSPCIPTQITDIRSGNILFAPVPAGEYLEIRGLPDEIGYVGLEIYNLQGQRVLREKVNCSNGTVYLGPGLMSKLVSGSYTLSLQWTRNGKTEQVNRLILKN
ncbi:MAG: hypothetical protein Kow00127_02580 [Bacteroidales bacterium]